VTVNGAAELIRPDVSGNERSDAIVSSRRRSCARSTPVNATARSRRPSSFGRSPIWSAGSRAGRGHPIVSADPARLASVSSGARGTDLPAPEDEVGVVVRWVRTATARSTTRGRVDGTQWSRQQHPSSSPSSRGHRPPRTPSVTVSKPWSKSSERTRNPHTRRSAKLGDCRELDYRPVRRTDLGGQAFELVGRGDVMRWRLGPRGSLTPRHGDRTSTSAVTAAARDRGATTA